MGVYRDIVEAYNRQKVMKELSKVRKSLRTVNRVDISDSEVKDALLLLNHTLSLSLLRLGDTSILPQGVTMEEAKNAVVSLIGRTVSDIKEENNVRDT